MSEELVFRVLLAATLLLSTRLCAVVVATFIIIRSEGVDDVLSLQRLGSRIRAMSNDDFRLYVRARVPRIVRWLYWKT